MFGFGKKKKASTSDGEKDRQVSAPSSALKNSLLSLEQRLMFDAAAAATASEVATEQVAQEQAEAAVSGEASYEAASGENGGGEDVVQALTNYMPAETCVEIAFVDPTVPNYQDMLAGLDPNIEVIMLDGGQDGMQQMASALEGRTGIDAIHLISHGSSGELQLGTGMLNAESMSTEYADEFTTIRSALSDQADLLVYGCSFGEGAEGADAVNLLAELTGADVAASSDMTGQIDLGGDWEFEVQVGSIETDSALTDTAQMNWAGILCTETVKDTFSSESYSNNNGTRSWSTSWTETDASGGGASGGDVRVNSGQLRIDTDTVGNAASRGVNLSGATSARLTFSYSNTLTGADRIEARISTDNGATYVTLAGGVFSNALNTGSGSASLDISGYASATTRIQFIVTGTGGGDRLYVDNVQVSYDTGAANSAPTISSNGAGATASVMVAENSTAVTTVTATDANAGQTLCYSIAGGADAAKFTINSSTGALSFVSAPNYESPTDSGGNNVYDVTVQVSDGNGGADTQAIAVTVTNANEGPTDLALSANSVVEHASTGTVVGTVSGTDVDAGDTKTYSLTDTAGGRFAIDPTTGVLTVADGSLLNYEAATSHTVTVQVTDSGGQSYTETFTINLSNVNEVPSDLSLSANTVAENATTGTVVGTVSGTDVDAGDTKTYSLRDTAGGRFAIDPTTGVLTVADGSLLNYEAASSHTVTVQVTDSGGQSYTEAFTINLSNVNEGPSDLALSANTVTENATTGTVVGTVSGTDVDAGDTKTYSLTDTAGGRFAIDPATGVLTVADGSLLNYEAASSHTVTVRVTDSGGQSYTEAFTINLSNVNEGPSDLALSANTVTENATTGTVVGTVSGTDVDAGDTKTYSLTDTAGGRFAIDPTTGVLTVADGSLLNYEAASSHTVTVQVTDSGGQSYDETFTINLSNMNETSPKVTGGDSGEQTLIASLFQKNPTGSEAFLPRVSSPNTENDDGGSDLGLADELRTPAEWNSQPATVDILDSGRNQLNLLPGGAGNQVGGEARRESISTSSRQQDATAGNLDPGTGVRPEAGEIPWSPTEELEPLPDESGDLAMPMLAGLVGAAFQGSLKRKEKLTTMHGNIPAGEQKTVDEQTSQKASSDEKEAPPRAA